MVKISENLRNLINADSRSFKARLKNGDDLFDNIISLKKSVVFPSSVMSVGNALCSCIECTASDISESVAGKRFEAEITIYESDEWIKLGFFTAQKPTVQDGNVTFTAYDAMDKASNHTYSSTLSAGYHTAAEYFEDICAQLNEPFVPLDEASAGLEIAEDKLSGYSCRDALSYLAGFLGKNCIVNRDGLFEMVDFTVVAYDMLNPDRIAEPELSDADSIISYLACCIDAETTLMSGTGSTGFEFISPLVNQERLDGIYNSLCDGGSPVRVYKAGKITQILGDPTIDICDVLTLNHEGVTYTIPVMSLVLDFDGGLQAEIESFDLAEPNSLSLSERLSFEQKQSKEKTEGSINAMIEFSNAIQRAFGISHTTIGGITYFHDTETITDATYIYCMTTKGIAFADSWGGSHEKTVWKYGIDNDGNAIFNMLKAGKISSYDGKTYFDLSKGEICCQMTEKSHEDETIAELKAVFSLGKILLSNTVLNVEAEITPQSMDFNIQEEGTEDEYIKPETDAEWNKALQKTFGVENPDWTNMASWLKGFFTKLHAAFWSYANKKGITISSTSDSGKTTNKNLIRGNRVVMKKTSDSTSITTEYTADGIKSNQRLKIDAPGIDLPNSNTLLASPGWYMNDTQTVKLSQPISNQNNGIVLVFSRYSGGVENDNFNTFFVSKKEVELHAGAGHTFTMFRSASNPFKEACVKYLYITDTTITGHSANDDTGTGNCGITFNNQAFVLRYVIGV